MRTLLDRKKIFVWALWGFPLALCSCQGASFSSSHSFVSSEPGSSSVSAASSSSNASSTFSSAVSSSPFIEPEEAVFDFDELNDLRFRLAEEAGSFSALKGLNIADGDYRLEGQEIVILKDFLVDLTPGSYALEAETDRGAYPFAFEVADRHNRYRIPNGGFETGDLFGYSVSTVFKGEDNLQSFVDAAVVPNGEIPSLSMPYGGTGSYIFAYPSASFTQTQWEEHMGKMETRAFTLGGNGYITFSLGGGRNTDLEYLSVMGADDGSEIARYGNALFSLDPAAYHGENLVAYRADLSAYLGRRLYLRFLDLGGRSFDFMTIDGIETYHETIPDGIDAADIKPSFSQGYVPNQVPNGDFSAGLADWSVSAASAWSSGPSAWIASDGTLRSNQGGDAATGLIRSSLFRVDGSGVISLSLAAGQGARYDKDTFVSIREESSNGEIFRFANERHNGTSFVPYYADLSAYRGQHLYFEIVDNAGGSYDTIFVKAICTYYAAYPAIDFGVMARNLDY